MFLHAGASLHGHEFSPIQSSPTPRRNPLMRAAFSSPSAISSAYSSASPTNIRPARRLSVEPRRHSGRFSLSEAEVEAMSEDGRSYASEGSESTSTGLKKRKRKSTRTSISYQLAHPAPTLTRQQRLLHIRPRLLLQLQRISSDKRPVPCIDALPSTVVVPRLIKRFPRMFKGKGELGANDVIVVRSEDYGTPGNDKDNEVGEDESLSCREVLAVICQRRGVPGGSEICLSDGSVWYGTLLPRGVYEISTTDPVTGEMTTARWVQRVNPRRQASLQESPATLSSPSSTPGTPSTSQEPKYLFSILHPNSRRHPILASLTQNTLNIPDNYTTVSSSAGRYPPTSPRSGTSFDWKSVPIEEENLERTTLPVDDSMRLLIQVTGVWLALRKGWCPYFKYDDAATTTTMKSTPQSLSPTIVRALSNPLVADSGKGGVIDTRASTPDSNPSSLGAMGSKSRRPVNHIFRSNPSNAPTSPIDSAAPLPRRSVSTGTAYMQRAAARRAGRPPGAVASDSEGDNPPSSRAADIDGSHDVADRRSMPLPPPNYEPPKTPLETPARPFHRRVQSVFMSSSASQKPQTSGVGGQMDGHPLAPSDPVEHPPDGAPRPGRRRAGRWSTLVNFLRRG